MPADVRRPRVLGVLHGPQASPPAAAAALPRVLEAFAAAGADVVIVAPDDVSARVLAALGFPQPPVLAVLRTSALLLPAAHPANPLVAAWPLSAVTAPAAVAAREDRQVSDAAALASWRTRCIAAAYAVQRAAPVDLVVAAPTVAGTAVALVLSGELAVPVLGLADPDQAADPDRALVEDAARETWQLPAGSDDPSEATVAAWTREAARLLAEVAP